MKYNRRWQRGQIGTNLFDDHFLRLVFLGYITSVLGPKPTGGTLADEKVAFFYDYPELVKLRAEMSGRIYARLRRR